MEKKLLIINLIGGPCAGKSTVAAGIFYNLKTLGINVEMSLEFAKDKVYEEAFKTMDDQLYIFGKQYHKLWRLRDKVDVIITDSPLAISLYYNKTPSNYFNDLVVEQYKKFDNLMFFLNRSGEYKQEGRVQTEEESKKIDLEIKALMVQYNIDYVELNNTEAVDVISNIVVNKLKENKK